MKHINLVSNLGKIWQRGQVCTFLLSFCASSLAYAGENNRSQDLPLEIRRMVFENLLDTLTGGDLKKASLAFLSLDQKSRESAHIALKAREICGPTELIEF